MRQSRTAEANTWTLASNSSLSATSRFGSIPIQSVFMKYSRAIHSAAGGMARLTASESPGRISSEIGAVWQASTRTSTPVCSPSSRSRFDVGNLVQREIVQLDCRHFGGIDFEPLPGLPPGVDRIHDQDTARPDRAEPNTTTVERTKN